MTYSEGGNREERRKENKEEKKEEVRRKKEELREKRVQGTVCISNDIHVHIHWTITSFCL